MANPIQLEVNPFPSSLSANSNTATGINSHDPTAYSHQWSLGVQRQLAQDILLEAGYFGSKGADLPLEHNPNQPLPGTGNAGRLFQNFGNITYLQDNGNASFNSLQVKFNKRLSGGLSFLASYTFARFIDEGSGPASSSDASGGIPQNSRNQYEGERGLSDFNLKHRLVLSPVWNLPWGNASKATSDKLIGGWQFSGIYQMQTGRPFTSYISGNNSLTGQNEDRPNAVPGCNPNEGPRTVVEWFTPPCFVIPPAGTFGDVGRNTLIGPGLVSLDFAVARVFAIRELAHLQFRAEAFTSSPTELPTALHLGRLRPPWSTTAKSNSR